VPLTPAQIDGAMLRLGMRKGSYRNCIKEATTEPLVHVTREEMERRCRAGANVARARGNARRTRRTRRTISRKK
jgi:hypothetical protein